MSFRRKLSFRRSNSGKGPPVEVNKGDAEDIDTLTLQPPITETPELNDKTETNVTECVIKENIEVIESDIEVIDTKKEDINPRATTSQTAPSVGFPDGLAMDPLSPAALAVSTEFMDRIGAGLTLLKEHGKKVQKYMWKSRKFDILKKSWNSIVTVVLIEAKDLPDGPGNGSNNVYCKFKLGSEHHKSKMVTKSLRPSWRERFNIYLYEENNLEVTVWHKGKQKNFMGRCILDLSKLEKEKTHDIWQNLDCGFGEIHLLLTMSGTTRTSNRNGIVATTNGVNHYPEPEEKFAWYKLDKDWSEVGELSVTVHGAKGLCAMNLSGKADSFCVLELDNSRVQTHTIHGSTEPQWNKTYKFEVNDITSTLDLSIYDEALLSSRKGETLGKLTIPLLRINNGEKKWYALKDKTKRRGARGNCPRILLEMSVTWNPIKASFRMLTPKETKYIEKSPKFDIPLIFSNLIFMKNFFHLLYEINESLKRLFEWESVEKSAGALALWLVFWGLFRPWMAPLLLLPPFLYHATVQRPCNNTSLAAIDILSEDDIEDADVIIQKDEKTIKTRLHDLQDLTFTIKNSIDYIVSLLERLTNLSNFTVPYLSNFVIFVLVAASAALYFIPFNYLVMVLGIYKFTRKFLNPERVPNNDILDFMSRVPDNEMLKDWRELKVPEPNPQRNASRNKRN